MSSPGVNEPSTIRGVGLFSAALVLVFDVVTKRMAEGLSPDALPIAITPEIDEIIEVSEEPKLPRDVPLCQHNTAGNCGGDSSNNNNGNSNDDDDDDDEETFDCRLTRCAN